MDNGVAFTADADAPGALHLTREGGHSQRRVVHTADATGHAVQTSLASRVRAHPNITLFEQHVVIDLISGRNVGGQERQIHGAYALNKGTDQVETFSAGHTVLASGGAGKVYLYTTNPDTSTGDGLAMAWRAGCRVANLEFVQFHPTCLYHPHAKSFLITEAVRGEGGRLLLPDGTRFMPQHDERAELAPRDVVARAIDFEMKKRGIDCVYLDISHKPAAFILEHFPTIHRRCLELGIDITTQPIPVVPAAHYTCGGVVTDLDARTDLCNLSAVGEVTFTGLHGANRLASNSLLECMVFGRACARDILATPPAPTLKLPLWDESRVTDADEEIVISHNWDELRRFMWDYVGIVRTNKRLTRAAHRIGLLHDEIDEFYRNFRVSNDLIELRNLVQSAELIVRSAQLREESRGLHYSRDYPTLMPVAGNTVLNPRPGLLCPSVCGMPDRPSATTP
jgi:L-aspartate oxidase